MKPYHIDKILNNPDPAKALEEFRVSVFQAIVDNQYDVTEAEVVPFSIMEMQVGVSWDGFEGYLTNGHAFRLLDAKKSLETIGAKQTAAIVESVFRLLKEYGVDPADDDAVSNCDYDEFAKKFKTSSVDLSSKFQNGKEDYQRFLLQWMRDHVADFK